MNAAPRRRRVFSTVVLATLVAWAIYAVAVPFGRGPDEDAHAAYAGFLADRGRLPHPVADRDLVAANPDLYQIQHPPLYYAALALFARFRPDVLTPALREANGDPERLRRLLIARARDPGDEIVLPYPRRVAWSETRPRPDPFALRSGANDQSPAITTEAFYLRLRWTGGVALLLLVYCLRRATRGEDDALGDGLGGLAVAATIAVPQFAANFAFLNSDQFAILFSAAGFAVLASAADPTEGRRRPLAAGLLLGLGLASKLFAAGGCVAAGVFLLCSAAPLRRRLVAAALTTAAALAVGAPWVVRQFVLGVGVDPLSTTGLAHPETLRLHPPDASGVFDLVGDLARAWFASVGSELSGAGPVFETLAALLPIAAIVGGLGVSLDRGAPPRARAACAAFCAGLVVQTTLVVAANRWFSSPQGRYLHALDLPGAMALAYGARRLFADRAAGVLGALALVGLAAGLWVQHGIVLPSELPLRSRVDAPDVVGYVDAGSPGRAAREAEANPPDNIPGRDVVRVSSAPAPEDTVLRAPGEVAVRTPPLVPGRLYVAEVRLRRIGLPGALFTLHLNETLLGGPFTPERRDDWIRLPFVATSSMSEDAEPLGPRLRVRSLLRQHEAALSEARIVAVPLTARAERTSGGATEIRFASSAPDRLPPLECVGPAGDALPLRFDGAGIAAVPAAVAASGETPRTTTVRWPETTFADFKPHDLGEARRNRGFRHASAFYAHVFEATPSPRPVLTLFQALDAFPAGEFRVLVEDENRRPYGPGKLRWTGREAPMDAADARLVVPPSGPAPAAFAELTQVGPEAAVDGIVFRARPALTLTLAP